MSWELLLVLFSAEFVRFSAEFVREKLNRKDLA